MKIRFILNFILVFYVFIYIAPNKSKGQHYRKDDDSKTFIKSFGGIVRGDTSLNSIYLTITGGDYNDGGKYIRKALNKKGVLANFFFTGDFYRLSNNQELINSLINDGHYLGPHSDKHLLYVSWDDRDSLLVDKAQFTSDLLDNYSIMQKYGINIEDALYFIPPFEWYNEQISKWTEELGCTLINFTPGTRSNADYTTPDMGDRYVSSDKIYQSILDQETKYSYGLSGFILLIHIGTHPDRKDKFYFMLPKLIDELSNRGYRFSLLTEMEIKK